ncbi:MAG: hypothetical protein HY903_19925 [Deltaproteobacteria bacterium]|nr:hypothetical protein [Deltaproteobacteria bacterium]
MVGRVFGVLVLALGVGACVGGVEADLACGVEGACADGYLCVDNSCKQLCDDDGACMKAESCQSGYCQLINTDCSEDSQCVTPASCESATGANCQGGTCHYQLLTCEQPPPVNPCRLRTGICDKAQGGGACSGAECCAYEPARGTDTGACPHAGEDPEGDGALGTEEHWTGVCGLSGACDECASDIDCLPSSVCSTARCADGYCREDRLGRLGQDCPNPTAPTGGVCVQVGDEAQCLLKIGFGCGDPGECASGFCVNGYCCDRACAGSCARCDGAGVEGTCMMQPAACGGDCSACVFANNQYACVADPSRCQARGNCVSCQGTDPDFSCVADEELCSGDCDACVTEGEAFNCRADEARCTGNCDACDGADNAFSCVARPDMCSTGPAACAVCAGLVDAIGFSCAADPDSCQGDCVRCSGADTSFFCEPIPSACPGVCRACRGSDNSYSCANVDAGTKCGSQSCAGNNSCWATTASVDGDDYCVCRSYPDCDLRCSAGGVCDSACACTAYSDSTTATCGQCQYASASGGSCSCANYASTQTCTWSAATAPNYVCSGGACTCSSSGGTSIGDGNDNNCDVSIDNKVGNQYFAPTGTPAATNCNQACANQGLYCESVGTNPCTVMPCHSNGADNGKYWDWDGIKCFETAATCATNLVWRSGSTTCGGSPYMPQFTYCRCYAYY